MENNFEYINWFKRNFFIYNYPLKGIMAPLEFYNQLKMQSLENYFAEVKEILYKMPEKSNQQSFLQAEILYFEEKRSFSNLELKDLDKWLEMFEISYELLVNPEKIHHRENELQEILINEPLTFSEELNSTTVYSLNEIQRAFYNYWYGYFVDQILDFLKTTNSKITSIDIQQTFSEKKIPEKYFALYHCFQIKMGLESNFEKNENTNYNKREIMEFGKSKYKFNSQGEGFYREFMNIDLTKKIAIAKSFKNYKQILIEISGNNYKIIEELKEYPN